MNANRNHANRPAALTPAERNRKPVAHRPTFTVAQAMRYACLFIAVVVTIKEVL